MEVKLRENAGHCQTTLTEHLYCDRVLISATDHVLGVAGNVGLHLERHRADGPRGAGHVVDHVAAPPPRERRGRRTAQVGHVAGQAQAAPLDHLVAVQLDGAVARRVWGEMLVLV